MLLLRAAVAVPPVALLAASASRGISDGIAIAGTAFVISEIVITRLADVVDRHGAAVDRERNLRRACAELVTAVDNTGVSLATRVALARLMPPDTDHEVVVSVPGAVAPVAGGPQIDPDLVPSPAEDRMTRLLPTRVLHPQLREGVARFETTLVCPLLPDRGIAGTAFGVLLIAADQRVLAAMRDAVEILAAQATLAMERIALTNLVNQRDGDNFLRTVVRHTADVVLIVDADERIRYASPSVSTVLGVDPPADASLRDLMDPDAYGQVAVTRQLAERSTSAEGAGGIWTLRQPDATTIVVEVTMRDLRRDRMVRGYVLTMRDVTERYTQERELLAESLRHTPAWRNRQNLHNRFR